MQGCRFTIGPWTMDAALFALACGDRVAGCDGRDGRDAVGHGHFWDGGVLGQQAAAGVGNPDRSWRAAQGSAGGGAGAAIKIAGSWFCGGIAAGNSGDTRVGFHCVPGYSTRSAGVGRCCFSDGIARAVGYVDSGATRAVGGSCDPAARRVTPRPSIGMMPRTQRAYPPIAILPNSDRDKWWYSDGSAKSTRAPWD